MRCRSGNGEMKGKFTDIKAFHNKMGSYLKEIKLYSDKIELYFNKIRLYLKEV